MRPACQHLSQRSGAHGESIQIPESMIAFMIMASDRVNDNHRLSILAAAEKDVLVDKVEHDLLKKCVLTLFKIFNTKLSCLFQGNVCIVNHHAI